MFYSYFQDVGILYVAGFFAVLFSTYAYLPYAVDTIAGRTQPQRASWLIWSVLGSIALMSQVFEGATHSLGFAAIQVGGTIAISILSIWRGAGSFLKGCDALVLLAAAFGIVLWIMTDNSVYALGISIGISLLGGVCTVRKAYRDPDSETMRTWVASFVAAGCALVAVGAFDPMLMAYPAYLFVLNGAIVVAIVLGRGQRAMRRELSLA